MRRLIVLAALAGSLSVVTMTDSLAADAPPDCGRNKPIPDCNFDAQAFPAQIRWPGPWFQLNTAYPETVGTGPQPWKAYDPFTQSDRQERWRQSEAYMQTVLDYALDGNISSTNGEPDFSIDRSRWFHAP